MNFFSLQIFHGSEGDTKWHAPKAALASLLAKTATAAAEGKYELFKTTHNFDGTYHNPQWLG